MGSINASYVVVNRAFSNFCCRKCHTQSKARLGKLGSHLKAWVIVTAQMRFAMHWGKVARNRSTVYARRCARVR